MSKPDSELVLGIDLGTTNSVVAVADSERARVVRDVDGAQLIPSVVSFRDGKVVVGELAREQRLTDAENSIYAVKRLIGRPYSSPEVARARERFAFEFREGKTGGVEVVAGGQNWTLPEISAFVLRECRSRAERGLGQSCGKAVITVPANFNELQRSATKAAGTIAGLDVLRIINEPTAAAVAHGYSGSGSHRVAVYDLGGGTFDITILESDGEIFEVVATAGDTFLGGDDFDRVIAESLAVRFSEASGIEVASTSQTFERFRAAAEWAKCTLSSKAQAELTISEIETGDGRPPTSFGTTLSRDDMNQLLTPLVEQSAAVCENAMRLAGLVAKDIDHVVLVGGSTRVPLVQEQVGRLFGRSPRLEFDPDVVVALGAAIQARSLAGAVVPKAVFTPPSPAQVMAKHTALRNAEAKRPKQPAFAPKSALGAIKLKRRAIEQGSPGVVAAKEVSEMAEKRKPKTGKKPTRRDPRREPASDAPVTRDEKVVLKSSDDTGLIDAASPPPTPTHTAPTVSVSEEKPSAPEPNQVAQASTSAESPPAWRPPRPSQIGGKGKAAKNPVSLSRLDEVGQEPQGGAAKPLKEKLAAVPTFALDDPLASEFTPALIDLPPVPKESGPPSVPATPAAVTFLSQHPPAHVSASDQKLASLRPPPLPGASARKKPPALPTTSNGPKLPPAPPKPPPAIPPEAKLSGNASDPANDGAAGPPPLPDTAPAAVTPPEPPKAPPPIVPQPQPVVVDSPPTAASDAAVSPEVPLFSPFPSEDTDHEGASPAEAFDPSNFDTGALDADALNESLFVVDEGDFDENEPRQDVVLKSMPPMILMDVTPHSLGIETVGGYCEHIIDRNAPIPVEQTRVFTTAQDGQDTVRVTICQGESRTFEENQELGVLEMEELVAAKRGDIKIEVTFMLDANGTLDVRATDPTTQKIQTTQINLVGGFADGELEALRERQAAMVGGSQFP